MSTNTIPAIPDGYIEDHMARLIPINRIPPLDIQRNDLVNELTDQAIQHSAATVALKTRFRDDMAAHVSLAAETYQVNIGGGRGNLSQTNIAGTRKITRTLAARLGVGEQILAAEEIINNLLDKWTKTSGPELRALVNRAFARNDKGNLSVTRLIDLSHAEIEGPEWELAVKAIHDALFMDGEILYFRAYERENALDNWRQITLDLSSAVLETTQ